MQGFAPCLLDAQLHLQVQPQTASVTFHVAGGQREANFPFMYPMRTQGLAAATLGGEPRKGEARCAFLRPRWVLHLEMGIEAVAGSLSPAISHVSATCEGHCLSLQELTVELGVNGGQAKEGR